MFKMRPSLMLVDKDFRKPRSRQFHSTFQAIVSATGLPHLRCLQGGWRGPRLPLPASKRLVRVDMSYDSLMSTFRMQLSQNGVLLQKREAQVGEHRQLTLLFDRGEGKIRIPWRKIIANGEWSADYLMCDYFFEKLQENAQSESSHPLF